MLLRYEHEGTFDSPHICRQLRPQYAEPRLGILTEKNENVLLAAYAAGADDCLVQPVHNTLLVAIVRAWLRRAQIYRRS